MAAEGGSPRLQDLYALGEQVAADRDRHQVFLERRAPRARSLDRPRPPRPPRLGNRGSLPSNAVDHVACWRCVPVVPGRGGMCVVPAAHLARRMLLQHLGGTR